MAEGADLSFIHLGISVQNMTKSFSIFGVSFAYYGLIIGIGMIAGLLVAQQDAKRRGQDPEIYLDFMLYGVIFAIIGARLYYVVFQWGYYKDHLAEIFNIRKGGLAIYGGIIAAVVTLIVFTRKRKLSFLSMADSACLGLVTGQIIGRWGNFMNCEAFGGYTDSLFAMRIKRSIVNESMISQELLENLMQKPIEEMQELYNHREIEKYGGNHNVYQRNAGIHEKSGGRPCGKRRSGTPPDDRRGKRQPPENLPSRV